MTERGGTTQPFETKILIMIIKNTILSRRFTIIKKMTSIPSNDSFQKAAEAAIVDLSPEDPSTGSHRSRSDSTGGGENAVPPTSPPSSAVYQKALCHWSQIGSDLNGMLGGCSQLHAPDIAASKAFIKALGKSGLLHQHRHALDCGSGIGRVTKHLLLPLFAHVDMVDFALHFIQQARDYIGSGNIAQDHKRRGEVDECFVESLHTFAPPGKKYDLIWVQWVAGHLTDADLVAFLKRCGDALADPAGCVIVLKENLVTRSEEPDFDEVDHSFTRPRALLLELISQAGMALVAEKKQLNFPKGFYEVRMMALRPKEVPPSGQDGHTEEGSERGGAGNEEEVGAVGVKSAQSDA